MSPRPRDTTLASNFTKTTHNKPTSALDPQHAAPLIPGPKVLIVGASRGIGANIALAYAQAGASSIILAARASSSASLLSVAQECQTANPTAAIYTEEVDITSAESVADLAKRIQRTSRLDVIVLNSGYSGPVVLKMDEGDAQDFSQVVDVNVKGTYLVAHHLVPLLLSAQDGAKTFIAVGSLAACIINGPIANTAYCVSKFAQARLVEFLAEQYKSEGLLAVAVHPGAVNTDMADKFAPESFKEYLTDHVMLCGAFCVWLSREKRMWLNGRLMCATWDVDELLEKKDKIEGQDLLKFGFRLGNF